MFIYLVCGNHYIAKDLLSIILLEIQVHVRDSEDKRREGSVSFNYFTVACVFFALLLWTNHILCTKKRLLLSVNVPRYIPKAEQRVSDVIVRVTSRFSLLFGTRSNDKENTWSTTIEYASDCTNRVIIEIIDNLNGAEVYLKLDLNQK